MANIHIKICGITTPDDMKMVTDLGADAVGVNFYPSSPRYLQPPQAMEVLRECPPFVTPVGVFVAQPLRQVYALAYQLGLRVVQWIGENRELGDPFPFALVAAFRVRDKQSITEIKRYLDMCREFGRLPSAILVDAHVEGKMGGTGQTAPWDLLADEDFGVPLILAGGLTPGNVGEAIRRVRPATVDVASGVESEPGCKDPEKVRRFIAHARDVAEGV